MDWARILAYITGTVDQELLLRNEYLAAENRSHKPQFKTPFRLRALSALALFSYWSRLGQVLKDSG